MPARRARVVQHADDPGRPFVARRLQAEPLDQLRVGRAAGDRRRPRVRHVGEQRAERDHELDAEARARGRVTCSQNVRQRRFGSTPSRMIASRPAPGSGACRNVFSGQSIWRVVRRRRARPSAASPGSRRSPRGRSTRTRSAAQALREVGAGERRALAAVVPAAERGDQHGALELRALVDAKLVRHRAILRGCAGRQSRTTNAVTAAQTVAASVTCTSTSHHGRCVRYWISPIGHLHERAAPSTSERAAHVRAPVAGEPDDEQRERRARTPPSRARASRRPAGTTRGAARRCCPDAGLRRSRACR